MTYSVSDMGHYFRDPTRPDPRSDPTRVGHCDLRVLTSFHFQKKDNKQNGRMNSDYKSDWQTSLSLSQDTVIRLFVYLFDGALCSSNVHPFLFFSTSPSIIIAKAFLISHAERKLLLRRSIYSWMNRIQPWQIPPENEHRYLKGQILI
jgi:hypothetical protein